MENNQYENIPPMLPSNDCCGGKLPRIQDLKELDITNKNCIMIKKQDLNQSIKSQSLQSWLINKDLIIQDLKDVIVSLNTSNKIIKSYYDKLLNEHLALRTYIYDVDIDDINEIILGTNKTVNQNYILSMENISLKATIDKNKEEIKHLKHINSQLSKKINRQLNTINKFSSEIKEFNKWK